MSRNDRLPDRCQRRGLLVLSIVFTILGWRSPLAAGADTPARGEAEADPASVEFFEKSVRPILATRCQGCHGPAKQQGGLRLDARAAILAGGSAGPAVVPGNPNESLLVDAINYGETYQMPPKSKLPQEEIAALTEWVKRGVPWGVETRRGTATPAAAKVSGKFGELSNDQFQERARFWSFQPIAHVTPPVANSGELDWARNPLDQFIEAALAKHKLTPSPEADRRTLIRRLSFDLTGLPPTRQDVAKFLADPAPDAYERLVDRLLASPSYGERWARHWLDLVRYAETAGHEYDYEIVNAYRYRDYVIRAWNADLPFDRFVTEQIAGDLLDPPRRHPALGFNESILGTGFYFLGEGTHSPVDIREEEMRRIDNQIDVMSKTFLGLTLACARCHDHKFDPITKEDYYALAGFLRSSRHQQAFVDHPQRFVAEARRLWVLKETIAGLLRDVDSLLREPIRGARCCLVGQSGRPRTPPRINGKKPCSRISTATALMAGSSRGTRSAIVPAARRSAIGSGEWGVAAGLGQARLRIQRPDLGPAARGAAVADIHDRYEIHSLAGRRAWWQDQRRHRRLRENPRPDLRRTDTENRCWRRAAMADAGPWDVVGPLGLP